MKCVVDVNILYALHAFKQISCMYLVLGLIFPISVQRALQGEKHEKIKRNNTSSGKDKEDNSKRE